MARKREQQATTTDAAKSFRAERSLARHDAAEPARQQHDALNTKLEQARARRGALALPPQESREQRLEADTAIRMMESKKSHLERTFKSAEQQLNAHFKARRDNARMNRDTIKKEQTSLTRALQQSEGRSKADQAKRQALQQRLAKVESNLAAAKAELAASKEPRRDASRRLMAEIEQARNEVSAQKQR